MNSASTCTDHITLPPRVWRKLRRLADSVGRSTGLSEQFDQYAIIELIVEYCSTHEAEIVAEIKRRLRSDET